MSPQAWRWAAFGAVLAWSIIAAGAYGLWLLASP